jgi:hypothetical protein
MLQQYWRTIFWILQGTGSWIGCLFWTRITGCFVTSQPLGVQDTWLRHAYNRINKLPFIPDFIFAQNVCDSCQSYESMCGNQTFRLPLAWHHFLSKYVSVTVANALVCSRLNYWNSLYYHRMTQKQSRRLQAVQNTLCHIVSRLQRNFRISHELKFLPASWLQI